MYKKELVCAWINGKPYTKKETLCYLGFFLEKDVNQLIKEELNVKEVEWIIHIKG